MQILLMRVLARLSAAVAAVGFGAAVHAAEYTLDLPDSVDGYWLCQLDVVAIDTRDILGVMSHDKTTPLPDGETLASNGDVVYTAYVTERDGVRKLIVDGPVDNQLSVDVGFCRLPVDADNPVIDFVRLAEPLDGGSPTELEMSGTYDGIVSVRVELCDAADAFATMQQIETAFGDAVQSVVDAVLDVDRFETDNPGRAHAVFDIVHYPKSIRALADEAATSLDRIGQFDLTFGNRILVVSNCLEEGLWIRVLEPDGDVVWEETFEGPRLIAAGNDDGTVLVTYAGGVDSIYLSLVGTDAPGRYRMRAAPTDDGFEGGPFTYSIVHFGGEAGTPNVALSTGGLIWITQWDGDEIGGYFDFPAINPRIGAVRRVVGGFHDVPLL